MLVDCLHVKQTREEEMMTRRHWVILVAMFVFFVFGLYSLFQSTQYSFSRFNGKHQLAVPKHMEANRQEGPSISNTSYKKHSKSIGVINGTKNNNQKKHSHEYVNVEKARQSSSIKDDKIDEVLKTELNSSVIPQLDSFNHMNITKKKKIILFYTGYLGFKIWPR